MPLSLTPLKRTATAMVTDELTLDGARWGAKRAGCGGNSPPQHRQARNSGKAAFIPSGDVVPHRERRRNPSAHHRSVRKNPFDLLACFVGLVGFPGHGGILQQPMSFVHRAQPSRPEKHEPSEQETRRHTCGEREALVLMHAFSIVESVWPKNGGS